MATYKYTNPEGAGISLRLTDRPIYGSSRVGNYVRGADLYGEDLLAPLTTLPTGPTAPMHPAHTHYELTDHLGNVTATITGQLLPDASLAAQWQPKLLSAQGYEPFGSLLPGRNYSSGSYRMGFNGKENDNEVFGSQGTFQDYGMRMYDTRIGRFPSVDPLASKYPFYTPYSFAGNKPIWAVDLDGLEEYYTSQGQLLGKYGTSTEMRVVYDSQVRAATSLLADPSAPGAEVANSLLYNRGSAGVFSNPDNAAIDWGARTNPQSIADNREYHSFIFSTRINGKGVFTYTEPTQQEEASLDAYFENKPGRRLHSDIHAHGASSFGKAKTYLDNQFSDTDMEQGTGISMTRYITTPSGTLQRFIPHSLSAPEVVSFQMPPDRNDPAACSPEEQQQPVIDRTAPVIPGNP